MLELTQKTYTMREIAALLGITSATVSRWARDGKLGYYRTGKKRVSLKEDVERLLSRLRVEATA